jgi:ribosomal protein S18 acetylase RimI-like enzyme
MQIRSFAGADRALVARIDASSRCEQRAQLTIATDAITWTSEPMTPFVKTYELGALLRERPGHWDHALVAEGEDGVILGFAAIGYQPWNRRATLWHLYVDRAARRRGVARALLDPAVSWASQHHARQLWLETQDTNCVAIAAYERLGFSIVGLDRSLYANPPADETAVFMSRPVGP